MKVLLKGFAAWNYMLIAKPGFPGFCGGSEHEYEVTFSEYSLYLPNPDLYHQYFQ